MSRTFLPRIKLSPRRTPNSPILVSRARKLAAAITEILQTRDINPQWEESLADVFPIDGDIASIAAHLRDPDSALAFFSWIRRRPFTVTPDSASYSTLLCLLARTRRFEESQLVLEIMLTEGKTPTREAFSSLVVSYARSGLQDKALNVYFSMKEQLGFLPDVADCNFLLNVLVEHGRLETAQQVYDEMLKKDGGANNFSTGIMVKGLCMQGRMEDARNLMNDRWGRSVVPDVVFYNMLIDGYSKCGDVRMGYILLREMELKGFVPTVSTYGAIINGFCRKGNFGKIDRLINEMKERGLRPNVHIYNNIIDARCKKGSILEAKAVLKQMIAGGCQPDIVTYDILISGFCRYRRIGEAENLFREAIGRSLIPNEFSYTPFIHGYCQKASVTLASNLLIEMMERGHKPDLVIFGALIHGLVVAGDVHEALAIREKMEERGVIPDAAVYNVLMNGLFKKGRKKGLGETMAGEKKKEGQAKLKAIEDPSTSTAAAKFKLNPNAPEFVPNPFIQMPIPGYFCRYHQLLSFGRGRMGSDCPKFEDQKPMDFVPDSNTKAPNLNENNANLIQKIVKQVEYQFSYSNLITNDFLVKIMTKDPEGYVPLSVIASWKKIQILGANNQTLIKALRTSSKLVVSEDGKKLKRKELFTEKGKEEVMLHAFVEFETTDEADKAPRSVIRSKRSDCDHFDVNLDDDQSLISQNIEPPKIEQVLQQNVSEKQNVAMKAWGRGRGKHIGLVQNYNGHRVLSKTPLGAQKIGHGVSENHIKQASFGPRIPDGTRVFTMGRGNPLKPLMSTTDPATIKL